MHKYTLSIIKPDAIKRNITGKILSALEDNGFTVMALKMVKMTKKDAQSFYYVHREKPFYENLCNFMASTPVVVLILSKQNAIEELRTLMGSTNPEAAVPLTIRKKYGLTIEQNSIHGSDSLESAKREIAFFFSEYEISHLELILESNLDTIVR